MKKPFHDLRIVELLGDRCQVVELPRVRIYLRLSDIPPLGWASLFSTIWRDSVCPEKRMAAVEDDAIWVECTPGEMKSFLLARLEQVVAQANSQYRSIMQRKADAEERQRELEQQIRAELEELGRSLNPVLSAGTQTKRPIGRLQSLWDQLKQALGRGGRGRQGPRHPSNHYWADADAGWPCAF